MTKISFIGSSKHTFAYQVKGGLKYNLNQNASFFAGYRYFGVLNDKFSIPISSLEEEYSTTRELNKLVPVRTNVKVKSTTIDIKNSFAVHGIEAGLIFRF